MNEHGILAIERKPAQAVPAFERIENQHVTFLSAHQIPPAGHIVVFVRIDSFFPHHF